MTERENALIAIRHGQPEWVPNFYDAYYPMGASVLNNQGEFRKGRSRHVRRQLAGDGGYRLSGHSGS